MKALGFLKKSGPMAFGVGMILAPDNLGLLGNIMGQTGWIGLAILIFTGAVYFVHSRHYQFLFTHFPDTLGELLILQKYLGPRIAYFPFVVKLFAALVLSTGILVSAGFIFNEVFVYWFPNFAVAFILLGFIFTIGVANEKISGYAQLIFTGSAITGLMVLIAIGLFQSEESLSPYTNQLQNFSANSFFSPLLMWVGFDRGFFSMDGQSSNKNQSDLVWVIIISARQQNGNHSSQATGDDVRTVKPLG